MICGYSTGQGQWRANIERSIWPTETRESLPKCGEDHASNSHPDRREDTLKGDSCTPPFGTQTIETGHPKELKFLWKSSGKREQLRAWPYSEEKLVF